MKHKSLPYRHAGAYWHIMKDNDDWWKPEQYPLTEAQLTDLEEFLKTNKIKYHRIEHEHIYMKIHIWCHEKFKNKKHNYLDLYLSEHPEIHYKYDYEADDN